MAQYEHLPIYKKAMENAVYRRQQPSIINSGDPTMRNLHPILVLVTSLLPFATVQAAPADLPETGQTTCYDPTGSTVNTIDCAGTGQDGELKAGVAWPGSRFVVGTGVGTTDQCVTDSLTGLMWVRSPSTIATWANALTSANNLTLCGFSDWRLPNINELDSLVNSEATNQATFLNGQGFTGVQANRYWSSSSYAGSVGDAWIVFMNVGVVSIYAKSDSSYIWPVRAGQ